MKLTPMRFKDYTWPYNPESCRCVWERRVLRQKLPFGGFRVQDLGLWGRCFWARDFRHCQPWEFSALAVQRVILRDPILGGG